MEDEKKIENLEDNILNERAKTSNIKKTRSNKIIAWFKDPYNLSLVAILILALVIRVYYFILTKNQPLWWDEAEYLATAKHWAFQVPYDLNPQRPPLFQFLSALIFMSGFGELTIKLFLVLLPSLFLVYAIYLLGKEMFDKKIGLIAAFLASISWTLIFWSSRIQPDFFSMIFQVLSILFMWKYWKSHKNSLIIYSGIFAALGFYFKVSSLLVPLIFIVFIILKDRISAFKNKDYYIFAGTFLITLLPYFVWAYLSFGTPFAFSRGYSNAIISSTPVPLAWYTLRFFKSIIDNWNFVLFIIGLIISFKFLLVFDIFIKDRGKCFDANIFSILSLMIVSSFYIFYIRGVEDRWVFLWLPFIFFLISKALLFITGYIRKNYKILALLFIIIFLSYTTYLELSHTDALINQKLDSYGPVKEAGIWIKENSLKDDKMLSISYTQDVYYTERNVSTYSSIKNESDFNNYLSLNKPQYLQVSVFEPHPSWIYNWTKENINRLNPVQVYFSDESKQQVTLVIYEIKY